MSGRWHAGRGPVKTMKKKITILAHGALLFALYVSVLQAQQTRTMPLIGYMAGAGSSPHPAFVQGMRDLGYVEGKNVAFALLARADRVIK